MNEGPRPPDINPYASPSVPDPLVRPDPGVGVWREGTLLVVHRDAVLPPICVKSGRPASEWIEVTLPAIDMLNLGQTKTVFRVPLSARARWMRSYGASFALVLAVIAAVLIPFTWAVGPPPLEPLGLFTGTCIVTALICVLQAIMLRQVISFVRLKGSYFWFSGAHRRFLAQLPPWPGLGTGL
jgi:hypothetical protein